MIFVCIGATAGLGVLPPLLVRGILDHAIPTGDIRQLHRLVGGLVGLSLLVNLIGVLQNYLNARVSQRILFDLRNQLYRHLQRMSLHFYTTTRAGEIVSRVNNDVAAVQSVATGTLIGIVTNTLTVAATLIVIFGLDWRLALMAVLVVPTFVLPTRVVGRFRHRLSRQTQERQADLLAFMQERLHIGGMLVTKVFGQASADANAFETRNRDLMELNVRQAMAGRWLFMCLSTISVAGPALIYWYGGYQAIQNQLSVGTIIAFVAYLTNLYRPVAQLASVYVDVLGAMAVFERIFEYLDTRPGGGPAGRPRPRHYPGARELRGGELCLPDGRGGPWRRAARLTAAALPPGAGPARRDVRDPPGRARGAGGAQRRRQDDGDLSTAALLRPHLGAHHPRRPRPALPDAGEPACPHRDGHPGDVPLPRQRAREPPLCPARRHRSSDRGGNPGGPYPRLHPKPPRATRRSWASERSASPAGRSSAWPSPGRC